MGIGKETKTARRWVYVVEWGAVRDSNQPSVRKSGQGLFASQMAQCLRICGQRGKNGKNGHKRERLDRLAWPEGHQHVLWYLD